MGKHKKLALTKEGMISLNLCWMF